MAEQLDMQEKLKDILLDLMLKHRYIIKSPDGYHFVCDYKPDHDMRCPNNEWGVCRISSKEIEWVLVHKYNGMKMWRCPCG